MGVESETAQGHVNKGNYSLRGKGKICLLLYIGRVTVLEFSKETEPIGYLYTHTQTDRYKRFVKGIGSQLQRPRGSIT